MGQRTTIDLVKGVLGADYDAGDLLDDPPRPPRDLQPYID